MSSHTTWKFHDETTQNQNSGKDNSCWSAKKIVAKNWQFAEFEPAEYLPSIWLPSGGITSGDANALVILTKMLVGQLNILPPSDRILTLKRQVRGPNYALYIKAVISWMTLELEFFQCSPFKQTKNWQWSYWVILQYLVTEQYIQDSPFPAAMAVRYWPMIDYFVNSWHHYIWHVLAMLPHCGSSCRLRNIAIGSGSALQQPEFDG